MYKRFIDCVDTMQENIKSLDSVYEEKIWLMCKET